MKIEEKQNKNIKQLEEFIKENEKEKKIWFIKKEINCRI